MKSKTKRKPRSNGRPAVRRCADPQCREQMEIALDAIFALTFDRNDISDDLESYVKSFGEYEEEAKRHLEEVNDAKHSAWTEVSALRLRNNALRAILETARDDIRGTRYLRVADFEKAMELVKA